VNYDLRGKFLRQFLPSLVEGSRAAWCGGASGDEGRNYIRGESTVSFRELQCCINPALRPLPFTFTAPVDVTTIITIITHRAIIRLSLKSFCYEGHICYLCKQQICFLVETTVANQFIRLFSRFVRNLPFIFSVRFIDLHFFYQFIRKTSRIRSLAFGISCTNIHPPISVTLLPKAYFCDRLIAGIAVSNFAEDMDVRL
jgi:hypothetical protein